jgi:hypothetical protein
VRSEREEMTNERALSGDRNMQRLSCSASKGRPSTDHTMQRLSVPRLCARHHGVVGWGSRNQFRAARRTPPTPSRGSASRLIEAQSSVLTAQEERTTLLQRVGDLEKQIAEMETWETEKQRYELKDAGMGALAYTVKSGMEAGVPPHSICANCYENRQKSILSGSNVLVCHRCGSDIYASGARYAEHGLNSACIASRMRSSA